jgi:hypothetical protein
MIRFVDAFGISKEDDMTQFGANKYEIQNKWRQI